MGNEKDVERLKKEKRKAERQSNYKEVASLCNVLGSLYAENGHYDEGLEEHSQELHICEALDDRLGVAVAHRRLGECHVELGSFTEALSHHHRYLSLVQLLHNNVEKQRAYATLGRTYLRQAAGSQLNDELKKQLLLALESFTQSLHICETLEGDLPAKDYSEMKAGLLLNIGIVHDVDKNYSNCVKFLKKAVSLANVSSIDDIALRGLASLADVSRRLERKEDAFHYSYSAIQTAVKLKDKGREKDARVDKALVLMHFDMFADSRHLLHKCLKKFKRLVRGDAQFEKVTKTAVLLTREKEELESCDDWLQASQLSERIADLLSGVELFAAAARYYKKAVDVMKDCPSQQPRLASLYVSLAQSHTDIKQYDEAVFYYKQEISMRQGDDEQVCRTWLNIADVGERKGEAYEVVRSWYDNALKSAVSACHLKLQARVLMNMSQSQALYHDEEGERETKSQLQQLREEHHLSDEDDDEDDNEVEGSQPCEGLDTVHLSDMSTSASDSSEEDEGEIDEVQGSAESGRAQRKKTVKRNEKGESLLHTACIDGNVKKVRMHLSRHHPVNTRDYCGWTPLHEAANHGHAEIVSLLLDHGAAINDPGGDQCGGITPLHDACNVGHLSVVELLVKRGADVHATDNKGKTALQALLELHDREQDSLTRDELRVLRATETLLRDTMQGKVSAWSSSVQSSTTRTADLSDHVTGEMSDIDEEVVFEEEPVTERGSVTPVVTAQKSLRDKRSLRGRRMDSQTSNGTRKRRHADDGSDSDEEGSSPYLMPHQQGQLLDPALATDAYRKAISGVGSALRQTQPAKKHHTTPPTQQHTPLIEADADLGDDWLIEDIQPTKRKRSNNSDFLQGDSSHQRRQPAVNSKVKKRSKSRSTSAAVQEQSNDSTSISYLLDCDDDHYEDDDDNDDDDENDFMELHRTVKLSQSKRDSVENHVLLSSSVSQVENHVEGPVLTGSSAVANHSCVTDFPQTQRSSSAAIMRVKVRIKDKLILVPIISSSQTVGWLCEEAAERYYQLCSLRPVLSLTTQDGALLSPDDIIAHVLSNNEEIVSSVERWNLPPLAARYSEACKAAGTVAYKNIRSLLSEVECSNEVSLSGLALSHADFLPLARALQHQSGLRELSLEGNKLWDEGVKHLCGVLHTLPQLGLLNLSANAVTCGGLQMLADSLSAQDYKGTAPQRLRVLRLDFNMLGDESVTHLLSLIKSLPSLHELSLAACQLTQNFFKQQRITIANTMRGSTLRSVDVSYNHLGCTGVELLLSCLPHQSLTHLNLTGTVQQHPANHLPRLLSHYTQQEGCVLSCLVLNNCCLTQDNTADLCRFLSQSKSLTSLSLSHNSQLSSADVSRLLETSASHLQELHATGCALEAVSTSFLDSLSEHLLRASCHLSKLCMTVNKLSPVDKHSLVDIWSGKWGDESRCLIEGRYVELSVK